MNVENNILHDLSHYVNLKELDIDELIVMKKRQETLSKHPYAIWQSKDGKYWYTTLPDSTKPRGVRQIRRNSREDLEDAIIEYWETKPNKITVDEAYHEWSKNRLETKKIVMSTYVNNNSVFNTHFTEIKDKSIDDIKPIEWCDFLEEELINHNMTKAMFGTLKSIVTGVVKWCYKREYISYSSSSINDLLEISERAYKDNRKTDEEEVYSEKETPIIIDYLCSHQDLYNLGLLLMFITGIRIGELIALKHKDFVNNTVQIRRTISTMINENGKICKGVKDSPKTYAGIRDVIVPDKFLWVIEHFRNGPLDDYIFISRRGNFIKYDTINFRLEKICKELNIPFKTTHKIRKTYGSILLDNNVDKRFAMEQMGHSDANCTENYYHRDRKDDEKKSEIINKLGDFYSSSET